MMKLFFYFLTASILFSISGCASLFNGQSQTISIRTHQDAEIFVNDRFIGKGQKRINLRRDAAHTISVKKSDCEQSFTTQRSFNKVSLLGVFMDFGLISIPTDFNTGAAWNIEPSYIHIQPECMQGSSDGSIEDY